MMLGAFRNIGVFFATVVAAGCALLWARSYRYGEAVAIDAPGGSCFVSTHPGRVCACWPSPVAMTPAPPRVALTFSSSPRVDGSWTGAEDEARVGPAFARGTAVLGVKPVRYLSVPLWAPAAATAWCPLLAGLGRAVRARRRRVRGLCPGCGYDLRATPARCPECGRPAVPSRPRGWWTWRTAAAMLLAGGVLAGRRLARHDFHVPGAHRLSFVTLGGFTFDAQNGHLADVPMPLRQLDGKRVQMDGFMIPLDQAESITEFALVESLFGSGNMPPPLQQTLIAKTPPGQCISYYGETLRIAGTLRVSVDHEDGYVIGLFHVALDHVELAAPRGR